MLIPECIDTLHLTAPSILRVQRCAPLLMHHLASRTKPSSCQYGLAATSPCAPPLKELPEFRLCRSWGKGQVSILKSAAAQTGLGLVPTQTASSRTAWSFYVLCRPFDSLARRQTSIFGFWVSIGQPHLSSRLGNHSQFFQSRPP